MTSLQGKVVLVTGGTGSFGRAVVKRLADSGCAEIRILSRDEDKQFAMRTEMHNHTIRFLIGDVRDAKAVDYAMSEVNHVFHAAALKQVPTGEFFPLEMVKTNVMGSSNVIEAAIRKGVKSLICLSTDKAVLPINALGMTKGLMEKLAQASTRGRPDGDTIVSCVRYGNVLCSRGSVVPLFMQQIADGAPITLTSPSMTRFLMTLTDAVDLVLLSLTAAKQGDLLVKKSPACTMWQLASALKTIFSSSAPIKTIGIRHGEKVHETLVSGAEMARAEDLGGYFRVPLDGRDLDYDRYFSIGDKHGSEYTSENTVQLGDDELKEILLRLPEVQVALSKRLSSAA